MASEDSDYVQSGFSVIHRLHELKNCDQPTFMSVIASDNDIEAAAELNEVVILVRLQVMSTEERDYHLRQIV
jgi:hypothetical protein